MQFLDIPENQQAAIPRALAYWVERWDWECPTLFGLEHSELQEIIAAWPTCLKSDESRVALAIQGAFRDLLFGASTPDTSKLPNLIGVPHDEAVALFNSIGPRLSATIVGG